jgi:rfaE bifunctional protein kinase chain/domain
MKKTWTRLASDFKQLRALVIGDIMLDTWLEGAATRLSPEAPVPVLTNVNEKNSAGGAANVACNLAALGITTSVIGSAGKDSNGAVLMALLRNGSVNTSKCRVARGPTITKTRIGTIQQQLCRLDTEEVPEAYDLFNGDGGATQSIVEELQAVDFVIISDYAKGTVTQQLVDLVARTLPKHVIYADPKPASRINWAGVGCLTPNRVEALQLAGVTADPDKLYPIDAVCDKLQSLYYPKCLCVTMGEDGVAVATAAGERAFIPSEVKHACDVTGAGDTFTAVFAAAQQSGVSPTQSAECANTAAGLAVMRRGTSVISIDDLRRHAGN